MNRHLIAALAVVAVLGLAYVFLTPSPPIEEGGPSWVPPHLERFDGLRIEYADRHVELRKGADGWELREPITFAAARRPMERVERLFGAEGDRLLIVDERPADAASITRHGFDDPARTMRVTLYDGGSEVSTFVVGGTDESASGTVRTWVRGGPEDRLYRLNNDLRAALDRPLEDWRDAEIVSIGPNQREALRRVELDYGDVHLALARDEAGADSEDPRWSVEGSGDVPVDPELVARAVSRMYSLDAEGFADGVDAASAGVATPEYRARLVLDGEGPITLAFGAAIPAPAEGAAERYVQRGDAIYRVREAAAENFMVRLGDLRPRDLLSVERDDVVGITLRAGDGGDEIVLERAEGEDADDAEWAMRAPRGNTADDSEVRRVLTNVAHVTATRIAEGEIDPVAAGLEPPRRTVTVRLASGEEHVVAVGAPVGGGAAAAADDDITVDRYVRVDDGPIGELRGRNAQHLLKEVEDLVVIED